MELNDQALPARSSRPSQGEGEVDRKPCIRIPCRYDSIPPTPVGRWTRLSEFTERPFLVHLGFLRPVPCATPVVDPSGSSRWQPKEAVECLPTLESQTALGSRWLGAFAASREPRSKLQTKGLTECRNRSIAWQLLNRSDQASGRLRYLAITPRNSPTVIVPRHASRTIPSGSITKVDG